MTEYMNTKISNCLRCGNEVMPQIGYYEYCMKCGSPIINSCTNNNCINVNEELPIDASYCPLCGKETTFFQYGLLGDKTEDIPF